MIFTLYICAGISAMGCGVIKIATFQTQEQCERALQSIRFDTPPANIGRSAFAYCHPGEMK